MTVRAGPPPLPPTPPPSSWRMPAYVRLALIGISLYASAGKVLLLGRPSHVNGTRGIMHADHQAHLAFLRACVTHLNVDETRAAVQFFGRVARKVRESIPTRLLDAPRTQRVDLGNGVAGEWFYPGIDVLGRDGVVDVSNLDAAVLFVHGGGYTLGDHYLYSPGLFKIIDGSSIRLAILCVEYTLSPDATFPTQIEEVVAAYRYLLDRGMPASSIAFMGDSAGDNLVVSSNLWIRDLTLLPMPAAMVLISPWVDLRHNASAFTCNVDVDFIGGRPAVLSEMTDLYLSGTGVSPSSPFVSVVLADLSRMPESLLVYGEHEVFHDDIAEFGRRLNACGVPSEAVVLHRMPHAAGLLEEAFGPECRHSFARIVPFLHRTLQRPRPRP
ncbi:Alpha/beta hydrolase fold-3 domain-containing protein [Plasmodiophora brassicae]